MATLTAKPFSAVEYIQELRKAKFTEEQAEAVVKIFEQQQQTIQEQKVEIDAIKSQEPATKGDIRESELRLQKEIAGTKIAIADLRYDTLKFVVWTGCGVSIVIIGAMFTLLKLMIH
jgi:hypothetical protein